VTNENALRKKKKIRVKYTKAGGAAALPLLL
jgi:hypothetical protein